MRKFTHVYDVADMSSGWERLKRLSIIHSLGAVTVTRPGANQNAADVYLNAFPSKPIKKRNAHILISVFSENVTSDVIGKKQ